MKESKLRKNSAVWFWVGADVLSRHILILTDFFCPSYGGEMMHCSIWWWLNNLIRISINDDTYLGSDSSLDILKIFLAHSQSFVIKVRRVYKMGCWIFERVPCRLLMRILSDFKLFKTLISQRIAKNVHNKCPIRLHPFIMSQLVGRGQ